jgi:hypothetical protein
MAAPACSEPGDRSEQAVGTASLVEGQASLLHDGETSSLTQGAPARVFAGDVVSVDEPGVVRVRLSDDRDFELRGGSLEVLGEEAVSLDQGSLLVEAPQGAEVAVGKATARFTAGRLRFDGPAVGRIGAYVVESLKIVKADETTVDLPRYWQILLKPDGSLEEARPLQIKGDDDWDRRLLLTALETDRSLANLATGFDAQFGSTTPPALLERIGAIGVGPEALAPFDASPRSNLVLALAFTRVWKKDNQAELGKGFIDAMTLNVLGASWGLLVQQFGVDPAEFIARVQTEINGIPIAPPPSPVPPAPPVRSTPRRPTTAAPTPPPLTTVPAPPATPAASPSPGAVPPDSLLPLLPPDLRRIVEELFGIVEGLLPIL